MEGAWAEDCVVVAGAQSNVSNLRAVELGQEQLRLMELERQATEECERCLDKPWNEYPEVCEFLAQFEPGVKFTTRNALVLDGGSRRGKTQFALSLVLARAGVEVNYSNALQEPPLQELYQPSVRDLILFDGCRFELLLKSERIFQGAARPGCDGHRPKQSFHLPGFRVSQAACDCEQSLEEADEGLRQEG